MKQKKKIDKRLESRIKGHEQLVNNPKNKNPEAYTKPGSRKK